MQNTVLRGRYKIVKSFGRDGFDATYLKGGEKIMRNFIKSFPNLTSRFLNLKLTFCVSNTKP